jgi:glycine/D-amino acid oxidase-like deaminating enzyme/nitrite reductase/ring-hydroxylating ferredoxin subunit
MINRDGSCTSLWQESVKPYKEGLRGDNNFVYDAIIVGGGITGVSTALLLQEEGKKCLLLEAANLCFGTTGGTTAHLNTVLDTPYNDIIKDFGKEKAQLVAQSLKEAIQLIRHNITKYQIDCGFSEAHAYVFAQDNKQVKQLDSIHDACIEVAVNTAYTAEIPIPVPFNKALIIDGQAQFHPIDYVYGLAMAFEKAGGVIVQHCRVTGAEENELVTVETTEGEFRGRALIYATHIPPTINLLHLRCAPYRSYAMAVTLNGNKYPRDLSYDLYDPYHYYRAQIVNGQPYLIAGGNDHKTGHEENTDQSFLKLESHLRHYFDIKEVWYKWSAQYFEPADGLPYIGHLPGHTGNIFVATGYGGNGMILSSVAATLLKRMIMNQESPYIDVYNPNRVKPVAGFVNFIKHNADVVKKFAGKLFSGEELKQLIELAPGEGRVVKYNDEKIALYKNDDGSLHAVSPVCTHMKCEVQWNTAEKSWDCPCHGARYDCEGNVLTGPAVAALEKVEISDLIEK